MTNEEIIATVRKHAEDNYTEGGWDVIVESYDDEEIIGLVDDFRPAGFELDELSPSQAIDACRTIIDVYADRQADARNSAF